MDATTIARYQPGGDLYAQIVTQYGQSNADAIAAAAATGDQTQVNQAFQTAVAGPSNVGSTSTLVNLYDQLTTDPLAAPVADANVLVTSSASSVNSLLSNSITSLLTNPSILIVLVLALFFYFGGAGLIRGWLAKKFL